MAENPQKMDFSIKIEDFMSIGPSTTVQAEQPIKVKYFQPVVSEDSNSSSGYSAELVEIEVPEFEDQPNPVAESSLKSITPAGAVEMRKNNTIFSNVPLPRPSRLRHLNPWNPSSGEGLNPIATQVPDPFRPMIRRHEPEASIPNTTEVQYSFRPFVNLMDSGYVEHEE